MKKLLAAACSILIGATIAMADQVYSYTVTGVIRALPGNGRAANEILVKHDPIPDYRDEGGNVVGMMAMTMPFYLADPQAAANLQVGDTVKMVLEQQLKPTFSEKVTSIEKTK
jgi:Cu/Ag efflux protein CusF